MIFQDLQSSSIHFLQGDLLRKVEAESLFKQFSQIIGHIRTGYYCNELQALDPSFGSSCSRVSLQKYRNFI